MLLAVPDFGTLLVQCFQFLHDNHVPFFFRFILFLHDVQPLCQFPTIQFPPFRQFLFRCFRNGRGFSFFSFHHGFHLFFHFIFVRI